jgi:hypothetical protein
MCPTTLEESGRFRLYTMRPNGTSHVSNSFYSFSAEMGDGDPFWGSQSRAGLALPAATVGGGEQQTSGAQQSHRVKQPRVAIDGRVVLTVSAPSLSFSSS